MYALYDFTLVDSFEAHPDSSY